MELYLVEMVGIAAVSLLYWLFLVVTGRKDKRMSYICLYLFAYMIISALLSALIHDSSLALTLAKSLFLPLFAALYPVFVERHPSKSEKRILVFLFVVGLIPLLSAIFISGAYWLSALTGHLAM